MGLSNGKGRQRRLQAEETKYAGIVCLRDRHEDRLGGSGYNTQSLGIWVASE